MAQNTANIAGGSIKYDTRKHLTRLVSVLDNRSMPGTMEFHEALEALFRSSRVRVATLNKKLSDLREAYAKYRELSKEQEAAEDQFRVLVAIFANIKRERESEVPFDIDPGIIIHSAKEERDKTPLWKVIREVARSVTEIRIVELEAALRLYGFKHSRQAIESAIDTHKDVFRSTRKGRERFVSLK